MPDSRFFPLKNQLTLQDIVNSLSSTIDLSKNKLQTVITGVQTLSQASGTEISFLHNSKYLNDLKTTKALGVCIEEKFIQYVPQNTVVISSASPYKSYAQIAKLLYDEDNYNFMDEGVKDKKFTSNIQIAKSSFIGKNVTIGTNSVIEANSNIGAGVIIGDNCHIAAGVTISHAVIGNNVKIAPGVCIGQPGFGFYIDEKVGHITVPQLARVVIADNVDIGSNVTIDRGTLEDTFIGTCTRIDNLVQIGHGVKIGKNCIIVAQVGIAGSTCIGNNVVIAGQTAIAGHITIGDNVQIAGKSGIFQNIAPNSKVAGFPAVPINQWHRQTVALQRLVNKQNKQ